MKFMIPYSRQNILEEDINEVIKVLKSDFLTQGPKVEKFEKFLSTKVGAKYAIAVNSATSALHISCMALGLNKGDYLWTSPITFVASANCALYCGAKVDLVDISSLTYNLCPKKLEIKLKKAKTEGKLPKIVVAVHLSGQSCDMQSIHRLSKIYNFKIIEDASHAIGGKYKNKLIGNSLYSDITVFSFHPVKIITTAEGGAALTNNHSIAEKLFLFRQHGINKKKNKMINQSHGEWYYEQTELGYNYRMNDIQAALGLSQLKKLDKFIFERKKLAKRYDNLICSHKILKPYQEKHNLSSWHLYIIRLKLDKINKTHKEIFSRLRSAGIGVQLHYIPLHFHPFYKKILKIKKGTLNESEKYYEEALSIPIYPGLKFSDQKFVINKLKEIIN